jgi:hypothetical protein
MPSPARGSFTRAGSSCPTCGAPAEEGQLVCLECGSRVALDYRRPPSWRVPVAIVATVVLLVAAAAAIALKQIGDDAEREVGRTPIKAKDGAPGRAAAGKEQAPSLVRQGSLYRWPRELEGFTVVLLASQDRASANEFARSAARGQPAKIGVIAGDDFRSLNDGLFVVFAGRYESRALADRAANRLEGRFDGAFPQRVER